MSGKEKILEDVLQCQIAGFKMPSDIVKGDVAICLCSLLLTISYNY